LRTFLQNGRNGWIVEHGQGVCALFGSYFATDVRQRSSFLGGEEQQLKS
jgi:hypothetical protein